MKILPVILLASALALSGCGTLIPKNVEFFQDKVAAVPEATSRETETQKQAAKLAAARAKDTLIAAVAENASPSVVIPASDTATLTESVSTSVGQPLHPSSLTAPELATKLDSAVASLGRRLDDFKEENNANSGKKIEGTGVFQISYFVWIGLVLFIGFILFIAVSVGWSILKVFALTNPPLAMGINVASMGAKTVSKGFTQLVRGGENFKDRVNAEIADKEIATKVLELFKSEQQKAQNEDVQEVVKHLTQ